MITLPSADEAIRSAVHADVNVVDFDDGLLAGLRQAVPATPIIVLTGSAFSVDRKHAEGAGRQAFLALPCMPELSLWSFAVAELCGPSRVW